MAHDFWIALAVAGAVVFGLTFAIAVVAFLAKDAS